MKTDKEKILTLKDGEQCCLNMFEGGGALVTLNDGIYGLFEIPVFGGEPRLIDAYSEDQIEDMIKEYKGWT